MHFVSNGDNLHEMSNPVSGEKNKKNISTCHLLKILSRVLLIKKKKQELPQDSISRLNQALPLKTLTKNFNMIF